MPDGTPPPIEGTHEGCPAGGEIVCGWYMPCGVGGGAKLAGLS